MKLPLMMHAMSLLRDENANVLTVNFPSGLRAWDQPCCCPLSATRYTVFIMFFGRMTD